MTVNDTKKKHKINKELIGKVKQLTNEFEALELDYVIMVGSRIDENQKVESDGLVVCCNDSPIPVLGGIAFGVIERVHPLRRFVQDLITKTIEAFKHHTEHCREHDNKNKYYN